MSHSQVEFLLHILDETNYLMDSSKGLSKREFVEDEDLKRAYTRSIGIMGEAVKHVTEDLRSVYPQIAWSGMARMGGKLIHHYFGVDYDLVWEVVVSEVLIKHAQLTEILED